MIPVLLKKCLVTLVAVLTFGLVVPNMPAHYVEKQHEKGSIQKEQSRIPAIAANNQLEEGASPETGESLWKQAAGEGGSKERLIAAFSDYAVREAQDQGLYKFGGRVTEHIGSQYVSEVAPAFASAVRKISSSHDKDWVRNLAVTHSPSSGMGERILHVYLADTGQEVLKLHVRRDHPPQDGYWFDFHYHTVLDGFEKHHELKKVYWGKNMPPKWRV